MDGLSFVDGGGDGYGLDGGWEVINGEVNGSEVGYLSVGVVADVSKSIGTNITSFGGALGGNVVTDEGGDTVDITDIGVEGGVAFDDAVEVSEFV